MSHKTLHTAGHPHAKRGDEKGDAREERDPIADYKEWADNRYNPGYFTGGRFPPVLRAYQKIFSKPRDKRIMLALLIILGLAMAFGAVAPLFQ
jgi:hypothetical protein